MNMDKGIMMDSKKTKPKTQTPKITEFELAVAAHNGDQAAMETLWKRHRRRMIGMLGKYNNRLYQLTQEEMESEAAEIFMHKLKEIFKPEKVRKSPDEWSFSYMLTGGMRNRRDKLITEYRNHGFYVDEYDETDPSSESEELDHSVYLALEWDDSEYIKYDPERATLRELDASPEEKEEALMEVLTPFQKALLKLRQADMSIQQIADRMGCGFTKVRKQIIQARELGYAIFEVKA